MKRRSANAFRVEVTPAPQGSRLRTFGDLDRAVADQLRIAGRAIIRAGEPVSIDLRGADIIDSAALGVLIELRRLAEERDSDFTLVISSGYQRTLFETTGLDTYFHLEETNE